MMGSLHAVRPEVLCTEGLQLQASSQGSPHRIIMLHVYADICGLNCYVVNSEKTVGDNDCSCPGFIWLVMDTSTVAGIVIGGTG